MKYLWTLQFPPLQIRFACSQSPTSHLQPILDIIGKNPQHVTTYFSKDSMFEPCSSQLSLILISKGQFSKIRSLCSRSAYATKLSTAPREAKEQLAAILDEATKARSKSIQLKGVEFADQLSGELAKHGKSMEDMYSRLSSEVHSTSPDESQIVGILKQVGNAQEWYKKAEAGCWQKIQSQKKKLYHVLCNHHFIDIRMFIWFVLSVSHVIQRVLEYTLPSPSIDMGWSLRHRLLVSWREPDQENRKRGRPKQRPKLLRRCVAERGLWT